MSSNYLSSTNLSSGQNRHVNPPGGGVGGGLLERLSVQPGGLLHVLELHAVAEPHPGVGLGQPDEALELPGVGGDLAPPRPNFPHLYVILNELLAGGIGEDGAVSLFGVLDVIPKKSNNKTGGKGQEESNK